MAARPGRLGGTLRETLDNRHLIGAAIMAVSGVVTVVGAVGLTLKIIAGALMLAAGLGLTLARRVSARRASLVAVGVAVAAGITVVLIVPNGFGTAPVLIGAAVLPRYLSAGWQHQVGIAVVSLAYGLSIAVTSGTAIGLVAGVGAWALADRSVEQAAFRAEHDRTIVLLAEVEASRHAQREAAAAQERNRIAGEMHDVLAHSLAGLSMQLQAVRAVAAAEGASSSITGPIDRAADLAREGAREARAAVGALRGPRLRGVADLEGLVNGFPGEVGLRVDGRPAQLGAEAGHAVFRAVQEAMTNAARYATGSGVEVHVAWDAAWLRVRVRDHGLPAGHELSGVTGSGTGIRSMIGRVEAAGGRLAAGPAPDGPGWLVEMTVPVVGDREEELSA
jgi:signal transduction histidine kinase